MTSKDVIQWLATIKESWLLILDNCDDPAIDFARYIPSKGGSIIITTRLTECRIHGTWENIDELGEEDATRLLLKASGLENGDQKALAPVAESVVNILGQHALALVHAGAYIREGYCTLSEYSQFFRDEQNRLMVFRPKQQTSRYGSVYTTFEVSAKALSTSDRHDNHLALELLSILAFLDRESVEEDMFIEAFNVCHKLEGKSQFVWEENGVQWFERCTTSSTGDGLVMEPQENPGESDNTGSVPNVLCAWRGWYHHTAAGVVHDNEPIEACSAVQWVRQDSVTSQDLNDPVPEQSVLSHSIQDMRLSEETDCSSHLAINHHSRSPVKNTFSTDTIHDPDHGYGVPNSDENDDIFWDYKDPNDKGEIYHLDIWHCYKVRSSGLVERQKTMRLRAACIRLANLSLIKFNNNTISMHPLVHEWARTRLGEVARQHAWEQALSILALSSYDEVVGTAFIIRVVPHIETCFRNRGKGIHQSRLSLNAVRALYHLAWVYQYHDKFEASLAILRTLSDSYRVQPHTWSFKSKVLLREEAKCLGRLGRVEEMQGCVEQVMQSTTRWFAPHSWEVCETQALLADIHYATGNHRAAVNLYERLYESCLQVFVSNNLRMQGLLRRLTRAHMSLGNNERVVALLYEELRISAKLYPFHHPAVLDNLDRLAESYITVGAAQKAVILLKDVVKLESAQIPRDYWWLRIASTLARAHQILGEYQHAIPILEEVRFRDSRTLLSDDPVRVATLTELARAYLGLGKPKQAATLLEEVVEIDALRLPPNDAERLRSMDALAQAYLKIDRLNEAVTLLEEVVKIDVSSVPLNDSRRLSSMDRLARAYLELHKPYQSAELLEQVVHIERSILPPNDPGRLISMDRLACAYLQLDKPSQAAKLLEEVVEIERSSLPPDDPERLVTVDRLARVYLRLNKPNQAVPLLEEIVALRTSHLREEDKSRLLSVRKLAWVYTNLGLGHKVCQAVSLLEEVMGKGRETLHTDLEQLARTQEMLAKAQEKLRQKSGEQSLASMKRCFSLLTLDDGNEQNNENKKSRPM
jgi:tetratricopeptide (TPR) repeat protein